MKRFSFLIAAVLVLPTEGFSLAEEEAPSSRRTRDTQTEARVQSQSGPERDFEALMHRLFSELNHGQSSLAVSRWEFLALLERWAEETPALRWHGPQDAQTPILPRSQLSRNEHSLHALPALNRHPTEEAHRHDYTSDQARYKNLVSGLADELVDALASLSEQVVTGAEASELSQETLDRLLEIKARIFRILVQLELYAAKTTGSVAQQGQWAKRLWGSLSMLPVGGIAAGLLLSPDSLTALAISKTLGISLFLTGVAWTGAHTQAHRGIVGSAQLPGGMLNRALRSTRDQIRQEFWREVLPQLGRNARIENDFASELLQVIRENQNQPERRTTQFMSSILSQGHGQNLQQLLPQLMQCHLNLQDIGRHIR